MDVSSQLHYWVGIYRMKRMIVNELRQLETLWKWNDIARDITILTASKFILKNHSSFSLLGLLTTYIDSNLVKLHRFAY